MKLKLIIFSALLFIAGCTRSELPVPPTSSIQPAATAITHKYVLIVKDMENPYMKKMFEGFRTACDSFGAESIFSGETGDTSAEGQIKIVEKMIDEHVDAIAIAANGKDKLSPVLKKAMQAGIKVVSLDSDVNVEDRYVHIQQASPEMIGRVLIQAARDMIGGSGEAAILTTTADASNQSLWVSWMQREMAENPDAYKNMQIVDILYGKDLYWDSHQLTVKLLKEHPEVKIIIAPTSMGILAAADAIESSGTSTLVTGLGLPSEMAKYIRSGRCPWMYLWNPIDVGYVAAYAVDQLTSGKITGAIGEKLDAGNSGILLITPAVDGGSEIVVGKPYMFDKNNVAVWENVF